MSVFKVLTYVSYLLRNNYSPPLKVFLPSLRMQLLVFLCPLTSSPSGEGWRYLLLDAGVVSGVKCACM